MTDFFDNLIPPPRRIVLSSGSEKPPHRLRLSVRGLDDGEATLIHQLCQVILKPWVRGSDRRALRVEVEIDPAFKVPSDRAGSGEAYELVIGKRLRLRAAVLAGLQMGLQTLRQILENAEAAGALPHGRIVDWPRLAWRGIHLDVAREMEYRPAFLRRVVENLAYLKLNTLHLYLENKFAYPSAPAVAPARVMTPAQARDLCRYARLLGVTIVPQIPTMGHMEHLLHGPYARLREDPKTPYNICPTHPNTRPFLAGLIADVAAAFEPPFIHLGYDESHSGVCPRCRRHGTSDQLLAEHLNWMNEEVKKHGARSMIYGDKFLSRDDFPRADAVNGGTPAAARAALQRVSRDVVITDWHYTAPFAGTTRYLVREGFEVHMASATNLYWHDSIPLNRGHHWIVATHDEAIRQGATGAFNCNWEFCRGQIPDNYWYFQGLVAERTWSDVPHDYARWGRRFAGRFWGVTEDDFTELAGLAETTPTGRKKFLVGTHVLEVEIPASLNPLWPDWRQLAFDHSETGEYLIEQARRFRRRATRNADTVRMLDMPGQIVRYMGVRTRQRVLLEAALQRGDKPAACRCLAVIRPAARQMRRRLDEAWRVYGCAVNDRQRLDGHLEELSACEQILQKTPAKKLPKLTIAELIRRTKSV